MAPLPNHPALRADISHAKAGNLGARRAGVVSHGPAPAKRAIILRWHFITDYSCILDKGVAYLFVISSFVPSRSKDKTMFIDYVRTSTVERQAGFDAQIVDLKKAGCERLFQEQVIQRRPVTGRRHRFRPRGRHLCTLSTGAS
jgi:hypothetical protein